MRRRYYRFSRIIQANRLERSLLVRWRASFSGSNCPRAQPRERLDALRTTSGTTRDTTLDGPAIRDDAPNGGTGMTKKQLLLGKIDQTKRDVNAAESALSALLGEMDVAPRAEKTTVSRVVEDAFGKLRSAKADLADLEKLISEDD
jgi:hypothetical protein